jgi:hypothetical protein
MATTKVLGIKKLETIDRSHDPRSADTFDEERTFNMWLDDCFQIVDDAVGAMSGSDILRDAAVSAAFYPLSGSYWALSASYASVATSYPGVSGNFVQVSGAVAPIVTSYAQFSGNFVQVSGAVAPIVTSYPGVSGNFVQVSGAFSSLSGVLAGIGASGPKYTTVSSSFWATASPTMLWDAVNRLAQVIYLLTGSIPT